MRYGRETPQGTITIVADPSGAFTDTLEVDRIVAKDIVPGVGMISTVFLAIEHHGSMWYETMVFPIDGEAISWSEIDADRYATRTEAEAGHKAMVDKYSGGNGGHRWMGPRQS